METRTRGKGTIDHRLQGSVGTLADANPTRLSKQSQGCPLTELNYDVYDKELLAIFEAFKIWRHYLEGSTSPIDIVIDHKNLEYFSTTKIPICRQARWLEYLFQFNLVICFRSGRLGTKLDALTRQWNVYPKRGDNSYTSVNPHNFCPVFTHKQIAASLWATILTTLTLCTATILDQNQLYSDILAVLPSDSFISDYLLHLEGSWSKDNAGFLRLNNRIYVLSWLGKTAKSLFIFLFFSFSFWTYYTKKEYGKVSHDHVTCHKTDITV